MPFDEFFLIQGAKKQVSALTSKGKSFNATRKIRRFDDDFDPKTFATERLWTRTSRRIKPWQGKMDFVSKYFWNEEGLFSAGNGKRSYTSWSLNGFTPRLLTIQGANPCIGSTSRLWSLQESFRFVAKSFCSKETHLRKSRFDSTHNR